MLRGLYSAASGLRYQTIRHDVLANNMANATTPGFKRSAVLAQTFEEALLVRMSYSSGRPLGLLGTMPRGVAAAETLTDISPGPLMHTANPLDLAIEGPGFFVVETPVGERYTRDGSFRVSADGVLVDGRGYPVLGQAGPIRVDGGEVTVERDGTLRVDGRAVGRLRVVDLLDPVQVGENLFTGTERGEAGAAVVQGYLEGSNVNALEEMVNLLEAFRAYEAVAKVVQAHDEVLAKAVNEVGRI